MRIEKDFKEFIALLNENKSKGAKQENSQMASSYFSISPINSDARNHLRYSHLLI